MMERKIRPPFDVNISRILCAIRLYVRCYENELFLHQQIDLQTRSVLGRVHDRNIYESGRYMRDQILRDIDVNAKRNVRM